MLPELKRDPDPLRLVAYLRRRIADLERLAVVKRVDLLPAPAQACDGGVPPTPTGPSKSIDRHALLEDAFVTLRVSVDLPDIARTCPAIAFGWGKRTEGMLYVDGELISGIGTAIWDDAQPVWVPQLRGGEHELCVHVERDAGCGDLRPPERSTLERFDALLMHEPVYDLAVALETATDLYAWMPEANAERSAIRQALLTVARKLPIHDPQAVCDESAALRQILMDQVFNGRGMQPIRIGVFGHGHIDLAWLWTLQRTRRKSIRTFASQLSLCRRYDGAVFQQGQYPLYDWVRQDAPALFKQVREAVAQRTIAADGTTYVEPDTNCPCLESLIRQLVYGRRAFEALDGRKSKVLWLPDCFGFTRALPQIMRQMGVEMLITSKISWSDHTRFPHDTFRWYGLDGESVLAHFITTPDGDGHIHTYNTEATVDELAGSWDHYQQKQQNQLLLMPYGYGDGGGGPRDRMLRRLDLLKRGARGFVQVESMSPSDFAERLAVSVNPEDLPTWHDELYLEHHRGTYSSLAEIKELNRELERLLLAAEALDVIRGRVADREDQWRQLLLTQFHDILPGTSIASVYAEERERLLELRRQLSEELSRVDDRDSASGASGRPASTPMLFNANGWRFNGRLGSASDAQWVDDLGSFETCPVPRASASGEATGPEVMRTSPLSLSIDEHRGALAGVFDRDAEFDVFTGVAHLLSVFEDRPHVPGKDAWLLERFHEEKPIAEGYAVEKVRYERQGARRSCIMRGTILDSTLTQTITVFDGQRMIYIDLDIDWRQEQMVLKSLTHPAVNSDHATYGIQGGAVARPTHRDRLSDQARFETPAQGWIDLSEANHGVSLMAVAKYGFGCRDNHMSVTLLRSPASPARHADRGRHHISLALYPHRGNWQVARTPWVYSNFANPPLTLRGPATQSGPLLEIAEPDGQPSTRLLISCVKPADDGRGIIVRASETIGSRGRAILHWHPGDLTGASITDLLEEPIEPLKMTNPGRIAIDFKPYQIITLRLMTGAES